MAYSHFIGVDISKSHLDFAHLCSQQPSFAIEPCSNTQNAIIKALQPLLGSLSKVLVCAEFTGMYSYNLMLACQNLNIDLWLENPAQIKHSTGIQRGKNDPLDARRIAEYAQRFTDRVRLVGVEQKSMEHLRCLISERRLLVADRAKYKAQLGDQQGHMPQELFEQKALRLRRLIASFDEPIAQIEQQIQTCITASSELDTHYKLLQSVPGVGPRLALHMLLATGAFSKITDPRKLCCHAGIAPFAYHSGINTSSRARVSHKADKQLKSLLHLAALSVVARPGELQTYYRRKVEQGKPKMSALNAVRSKLVHRMFSVVKRQQPYSLTY